MNFTHLEKETEERKENLQDWSVWNVAMRLICLSQRMKKCLKPVSRLLINVIIACCAAFSPEQLCLGNYT